MWWVHGGQCQNREPAEQEARGELTGQKTVSAELETTTAEQTGLKIAMVEKMEFKDHHIRADGAEKLQRPSRRS